MNLHTHRNSEYAIRSCDPSELETMPLVEGQWVSTGLHPWWLNESTAIFRWQEVELLAARNGVLALGEVGLDRRSPASLELQVKVLEWHIKLALEMEIPLILHLTDYLDTMMQLRKKYPKGLWIWHGFNGHESMYRQLLKTNTDFSIGRKVLSSAERLEVLIKEMPLERMWIESDQEDDAVLRNIYQKVSELRNIETNMLSLHIFARFKDRFKV